MRGLEGSSHKPRGARSGPEPQELGHRRGRAPPLSRRGDQPCGHPALGLRPPELGENQCPLFKATDLWSSRQQPQETSRLAGVSLRAPGSRPCGPWELPQGVGVRRGWRKARCRCADRGQQRGPGLQPAKHVCQKCPLKAHARGAHGSRAQSPPAPSPEPMCAREGHPGCGVPLGPGGRSGTRSSRNPGPALGPPCAHPREGSAVTLAPTGQTREVCGGETRAAKEVIG